MIPEVEDGREEGEPRASRGACRLWASECPCGLRVPVHSIWDMLSSGDLLIMK